MDDTVPNHVGLILDGNRRWAKAHGLPTVEGHRKGYQTLRGVLDAAYSSGVKYISAYVFSTENWSRSQDETSYLMKLAHHVLTKEIGDMHKQGIKIVWLGSKDQLSDKLLKALTNAQELTKDNTKGTFALCFNYGGQQEIVDAAQKAVDSGEAITLESISNNLYQPEVPPIDLLIRTSGEQRLSGFMLWRAAYSELYFVDKLWPDFEAEDIKHAISVYQTRQRRFGK